jgi:RNA polymerase sigma factor (sigma-70 family)
MDAVRQTPDQQPGRPRHLSLVMPQSDSAATSPLDFDALLLAVAQGERAAFARLFEHVAPRLKSWLMRSGSSDSQAEELAQEAMVKVWRKAAQFDPAQAGASTWIFTIARNQRVDHLRRQGQPAQELDETALAELPDPMAPPDEALHALRREREVRAALARLTPEQSQVIQLSYFDEEPHARIAELLGIPLGTVKSRIRLALNQMRRLVDGTEVTP